MNEEDTRAEIIEKQLEESGWSTGGDVRVTREYKINAGEIRAGGLRVGMLRADYVLIYKNRKLAVIEAKSNEKEIRQACNGLLAKHRSGSRSLRMRSIATMKTIVHGKTHFKDTSCRI